MGFLSLAYLTVANLNRCGISIHYQVSERPQYLVKLSSLVTVTVGHTINPPIKGLLTSTSIEPTPFPNTAFKVTKLQVHTTTPGK